MRLGQVANQVSRARVDARGIMVDDQKIKAILEWEKYEHCYRAFGELKRRLTSAPVLKFPELKKPFEVHTDASDFGIGGGLMQEG